MFQDSEKVLEKVRLLLNTNGCTEAEAQERIRKAHEMLEAHNLSMAQVKIADQTEPELISCDADDVPGNSWLTRLYNIVAKSNYCYTVQTPWEKKVTVIGRYVNVQVTLELMDWLRQQIERLANTEITKYKAYIYDPYLHKNPETKAQYREAFLFGVVENIKRRLDADKIVSSDTSKALTIRLYTEADLFAHKIFGKLSSGKSLSVNHNSSGYANGFNSGDKVRLTRPSHHVEGGPLRLNSGN